MIARKSTILIVENEAIVAINIQNRLEEMGYIVAGITASGEAAIQMGELMNPDLVLMDIRLKGQLDGIRAAEEIRNRFNIPVVYLTAYSDEETLQRAKITEPYGYILKPFETRELASAIEIALYKHQMEQLLKEREQWLATTLRSIGDGVITTDERGSIAFMNPVAVALTGWQQQEALGKELPEVFQIIDERTREITENPVAQALRNGSIVGLGNHVLLITKNGTEIPIDDSAAPIKDDMGNIKGAVLVFHDIIERKLAEIALRDSETRFHAIFDRTFNFIWLLKPDGTVLEANQTALEFGGIQRTEAIERPFWEGRWWTISMAIQAQLRAAIARAAEGQFVRYEVELLGAGGRVTTVDFSIKPVTDSSGQVVLLIPEARDISDRKQAEQAIQNINEELELKVQERTAELQQTIKRLEAEIVERQRAEEAWRQSEERFRNLVETSSDLVWELDENCVYTYASPKVRDLLGYEVSEILGKTPFDLMSLAEAERVKSFFALMTDPEPYSCFENINIHKDGHLVILETSGVPFFNSQGIFCGYRGINRDISERKRAEVALRESQEQLQAILDNSSAIIYLTDVQHRYLLINRQYENLFRVSKERLIGQSLYEFWPAEIADAFVANNQRVIESKTPIEVEEIVPQEDGLHTYISIKFPLSDVNGVAYAVCGISSDITERKQAEEALRESEEKFRSVFQNSPIGMTLNTLEGQGVQVNPALCQLLGYDESELREMTFYEFSHPEDLEKEIPYIQSCLRGEINSYQMEKRYIKKNGEIVWVNLTAGVIRDGKGNLRYGLAMIEDITERKQVEERLKLRDRAIAASNNGIIIADARLPNMPTIYVNPAFERITGYLAAEAIGFNCRFLQGQDTQQPDLDKLRSAMREGRECTVVLRNYRKDGTMFWNELSIAPMYDVAGNITHFIGIQTDITERKQAEETLLVTQERLQYLLSSSPAAIYSSQVSGNYGVTFMSENTASMLGYEAQEFLEDPQFWTDRIHPEDAPRVLAQRQQLFELGDRVNQYRFLHKDGTYRWMYDQMKLVFDADGNPLEIVGYWADISDRKQAEEQIKASLKEKEVLLKEIHHRVKNNLQIVSSLLKLQSAYIKDEEASALFKDSYNRIRSMALIHEKLYRSDNLARIDMADYIRTLVGNLFNSYGMSSLGIEMNLAIDNISLDVDTAIPCGLIINELVSNSLKYAFPNAVQGEVRVCFHLDNEGSFILLVSDNGVGLPPDFEPNRAESLGLQLVLNLTEQIGGNLYFQGDNGTEFRITFTSKVRVRKKNQENE